MEYINVKLYGASGNGIDDDTAAIQRAINYAAQVQYTLYFPAGVYKITSGLYSDACPVLKGDGNSSIIKSTISNIKFLTIGYNDTLVEGITFVGDNSASGQQGIWSDGKYRINIINNRFIDLSLRGIYLQNTATGRYGLNETSRISGNIFINTANTVQRNIPGAAAVYLDTNADYVNITDNIFTKQNLWAIWCLAGNFIIANNQMAKNKNCVYLGDGGNGGHGTLANNTLNHTFHDDNKDTGAALYIVGGAHFFGTNIIGCHIFDGDLTIEVGSGVTFSACTFGVRTFTFISNVATVFEKCRFYPAYGNNIVKTGSVYGFNNFIIYPQDSQQNGAPFLGFSENG